MNKQEKRWVTFWTKFLKRTYKLTNQDIQVEHMVDIGRAYTIGLQNGFELGLKFANERRMK